VSRPLLAAAASRPLERWTGFWPPLLLLAAWQVAAVLSPTPFLVAPPPSQILAAVPRLVADGLLIDLGKTLARIAVGVGAGATAGLLLGYAIGSSPRVRRHVEPTIALVHPTPKIAVFPLFLLLLGIGELPRLALVAFGAFFPIVINVAAGVRQVQPSLHDVATIFGATRWQRIRHVVWPACLPWLLTGLRIACSAGFVATLATELLASNDGLGHRLWLAWEVFRPEEVYVVLAITATLGFSMHRGILAIARRGLRWQPTHQRSL
jgi:ABC-type nitrate/sulfonate/bicarbonate transport system permease component